MNILEVLDSKKDIIAKSLRKIKKINGKAYQKRKIPVLKKFNYDINKTDLLLSELFINDKYTFNKLIDKIIVDYIMLDTYHIKISDFKLSSDDLHMNNVTLMRFGLKKEYSLFQRLEQLKCGNDVVYFTKRHMKIISIDDGIINFEPYPYQIELLNNFQENRFCIALQCRQSGKTTTTVSFILWFSIFHDFKCTGILANKAAQSREILSRIQLAYENCPFFIKGPIKVYNKGNIILGNNSEMLAASSSSDSIRGRSMGLVVIDEGAFLPNDMEFYESTYPVISSGKESRILIMSTPRGKRGLFYKIWTESEQKINSFKPVKVLWYDVPGRDDKWKAETIANTSKAQFAQEHECDFRGSVGTLIEQETLTQLAFMNPLYERDNGNLRVYKEPEEDHIYLTTVDTSHGVGQDSSTFTVYDITSLPYDVVCVYQNNYISPLLYPSVVVNSCQYYNDAYVVVEINDIGWQVANDIWYSFEYEGLLWVGNNGRNGQTLGSEVNSKPGVKTSTQTKAIGCSNFKTLVEEGKLIPNDMNKIEEYGTFISKGKSYEADDGAHDDLVANDFVFGWVQASDYFKELTNINFRERLQEEKENGMLEGICPFGIVTDNREGFDEPEYGYEPGFGVCQNFGPQEAW